MPKIPFGPTYDEMLSPELIAPEVRAKALAALTEDELNPIKSLNNITWKNSANEVRKVVLPPALTGVDANVVVMLGCGFPSGSHKVGPAYSTLIEGLVDGEITKEHTILGPSTGNFGIGTSYISNLLGLKAVVIMPDNMSKSAMSGSKNTAPNLILTPGSESDVILTLSTHALMKNPKNKALAQFELMANYRFPSCYHRRQRYRRCRRRGQWPHCRFSSPRQVRLVRLRQATRSKTPSRKRKIAALGQHECSTLANGGRGQRPALKALATKCAPLIHNLLTTDFIILIKDEETIQGLKIFHDGIETLIKMGVSRDLNHQFGRLLWPLRPVQRHRRDQNGQIPPPWPWRQCRHRCD